MLSIVPAGRPKTHGAASQARAGESEETVGSRAGSGVNFLQNSLGQDSKAAEGLGLGRTGKRAGRLPRDKPDIWGSCSFEESQSAFVKLAATKFVRPREELAAGNPTACPHPSL